MSVIPVLAGRRHDLPGRPGPQDHLRRLHDRARPRRDASGASAPATSTTCERSCARADRDAAAGLHGRGQQHDRQRAGPARVRPGLPGVRRAALRRRRARLRRARRARADEPSPYGRAATRRRHSGETYDNIVLVGGFSKAYSSLLAFLALPTGLKNLLKVAAPPYLYSGPSPIASLATVLAGFDVNEHRGDAIRADLYAQDRAGARTVRELGLDDAQQRPGCRSSRSRWHGVDIDAVGQLPLRRGVYVTLAAYPLVPGPGRLPDPGHRGEHRRRDRPHSIEVTRRAPRPG